MKNKLRVAPFGAPAPLVPVKGPPKPLKERDIQSRCVEWARRRGWYARKFVSPSNTSVPDYIFIKNGRVIFVEFKRPKGRPTKAQWLEIVDLELHGADVHYVDFFDTRWAGLLTEQPSPRMPKWNPNANSSNDSARSRKVRDRKSPAQQSSPRSQVQRRVA